MTNLFRSIFVTSLLPTLWLAAARGNAQSEAATAKEVNLSLPTYLLGPADPNPPFKIVNSNDVYPYPMLDDLSNRREPVTYKAVVLENEYLRVTVLPVLGGRLYSLYDKIAKREVFYRNESVKYGLIALRGAWISGGIEFNFPNGHTTDTVSPVSSRFQANADGSATVIVGDVDQVSEMYWQVSLTLRPHTTRLEEHVNLFNPTPIEHLYWFWDNAAVPATDDSRFIYPMRQVNTDTREEKWTFPIWKGIDYSRYENIRQATEMFGVNVHRSIFGVYYNDSDYGVVHCADFRDMTGKKIFTWGVAGDGRIWTDLLTDKDGPYNELQAGRFETQLNRDFMAPNAVESWTEYWYPVRELNGAFVEATSQLAINVRFPATTKPKGNIQVSIISTETIKNATVDVSLDGNKLKMARLSFEPGNAQTLLIPVDDIASATSRAVVNVVGQSGKILLHWRAADPIDGNAELATQVKPPPTHGSSTQENGIEEQFLRGVLDEKEGYSARAQQVFSETLERDEHYIPVLRKLAIQSYRGGNLNAAGKYIDRAIQQNDSDPKTQYEAGIVYRAAGRLSSAQDAFWAAIRLGGPLSPCYLQLGEIALSVNNYESAEGLLRKALLYNPEDVLAQSDLAVALRLRGKLTEALDIAAGAVDRMPLYPLALAERWRIAANANSASASPPPSQKEWDKVAAERSQNYLEAGSWYWTLHDYASADFILNNAVQHLAASQITPMVYYYLASNARHEGLGRRAAQFSALARAASYYAVFPNRPSDAAVLEEALLDDPADSHAQYFLGNFLFQYGRYEEAEKLWLQAASAGFQYSVLFRNLGVDAWKVKGNLGDAAGYYEKAIQLDRQDYRLYVDLDEIYAQQGSTRSRQALFANSPASVLEHDAARMRDCVLLINVGQPDKALGLLNGHRFKPWEQGQDVREIFVEANIQAGRLALEAKRFNEAEADFKNAMEYPPNLGIGKPDKPEDAAAHYWLGETFYQQGDKTGADREWRKLVNEPGEKRLSKFYEALAMEALGDADQAAQRLTALVQGAAGTQSGANNYYVAGLAERHLRREPQAIADFRKAVEINPTFWQAENEFNH